jgi:hypothetical protein
MGEPSPPPDITGLNHDAIVDAMVQWLFNNFEDPVERTPRDDGEWLFIWGGPYEAEDELRTAFPSATDDAVKEAIDRITEAGLDRYCLAPGIGRMQEKI